MNSYNVTIVSEKKLMKYKIIIAFLASICILCMTATVICIRESFRYNQKYLSVSENYDQLNDKYESLTNQYDNLYESYDGIYNEYMNNINYANKCQDNIVKLNELVQELTEQSNSLVQSNDEYFALIQQYEQREELFDKYEYAIMRTNGTRTDITYDQLINLEQVAEEKDIDVDLVLSISMVESEGTEKVCNSSSTARGYGQILNTTGKFIYEKIMNKGTYNHDYALNGYTNFEMMVNYLRYLENTNGSNLYATIRNYRGEGGSVLSSYIRKIDNYLENCGKSIASLNK